MSRRTIIVIALAFLVTVNAAAQTLLGQKPEYLIVTRAVAPIFPLPVKNDYAIGSVIVEVQVDAEGNVTAAHAVMGHPRLYHASENAAKRWLFNSVASGSEARTVRLTFVFRLMDTVTSEEDLSPIFSLPYQIEVRMSVPVITVGS